MARRELDRLKGPLEALRKKYNHRKFASPDPIEVIYEYYDPRDVEVAALIAASLSFGNVKTILTSCHRVLERTGPPAQFLATCSDSELSKVVAGFRHRYVAAPEMLGLLRAIQRAQKDHGSLEALFVKCGRKNDETILPALEHFADALLVYAEQDGNYLIPRPARGSACKRLHMFLRWMVRSDAIDLGLWKGVSKAKLVAPMDTHLFRISKALGFTTRSQPDLRAALEVTQAFKELAPRDPIRYDFSLTRLGIRTDADMRSFLLSCGLATDT